MAILRWLPYRDPFSEWSRLTREMDRLMSSLVGQTPTTWAGVYPPMNLTEDEDNYYVRAELPGVEASDLEIMVEGESLSLKGERKIRAAEGVSYHRRERNSGSFRRTIALPAAIEAGQVKAAARDGVLTVTLPKAAETKPRQIKVESA